MERFSIGLTKEQLTYIDEKADQWDRSRAATIRQIIDAYRAGSNRSTPGRTIGADDDLAARVDDLAARVAALEATVESEEILEMHLREWLTDRPPQKAHAKEAVVDVFRELRENGPLATSELQERVYEKYTEQYSEPRTMWSSLSQYLDDVPGVEKVEFGTWGYAGDEAARDALGIE